MMSLRKRRVNKNEYIERQLSDRIYDEMKLDPKKFSRKEFHLGMNIELEHFDLTKGDLMKTAKITLAHLRELPDYNSRLKKMEKYAEQEVVEERNRRIMARRRKVYRTPLFDDVDD